MGQPFKFTCAHCGQVREGAPSFGFNAPCYYAQIPHEERAARTTLSSDLCSIDRRDFFIRTRLEIPIQNFDEPFLWGVWVSLSQPNFEAYAAAFSDPNQSGKYFGWFSSLLPLYPETLNLKTRVHVVRGGLRPWLELERIDHPLCQDYHQGITFERAVDLFERLTHPDN